MGRTTNTHDNRLIPIKVTIYRINFKIKQRVQLTSRKTALFQQQLFLVYCKNKWWYIYESLEIANIWDSEQKCRNFVETL